MLPQAEHRAAKYLNNGLERDHGYLKQRVRPMRGFKNPASADGFCRGHGLMQNLRNGVSALTNTLPRQRRLFAAWPLLTQMI
jgi:transposase, IS6 family